MIRPSHTHHSGGWICIRSRLFLYILSTTCIQNCLFVYTSLLTWVRNRLFVPTSCLVPARLTAEAESFTAWVDEQMKKMRQF